MINILTPDFLDNMPQALVDLYNDLETFILTDISRRLKKAGQVTSTAEWQKQQAQLFSIDNINQKVAEILKKSTKEIDSMFKDAAKTTIDSENAIYKKAGYNTIELEKSKALQEYLKNAIKQTKGDVENITQSMGFAEKQGNKIVYNSVAKFYQKELNLANIKIKSGVQDYQTAIRQASNKIIDSGVRTINYESGYSINIDSGVRRAVLTSVHQMSQEMNNYVMEQFIPNKDDRYVEVTSHFPCRPSHLSFQGRVFKVVGSDKDYPNLAESTQLGTAGGLKGINCRHDYYAYIPNVSTRTYSDADLKEMERKSKETKEYKGQSYTLYEATQYQRTIENEIRKSKRGLIVYKESGLEEDFKATKARLKTLRNEYKAFSESMEIPIKNNRLTI